jgi:hypothetical protein
MRLRASSWDQRVKVEEVEQARTGGPGDDLLFSVAMNPVDLTRNGYEEEEMRGRYVNRRSESWQDVFSTHWTRRDVTEDVAAVGKIAVADCGGSAPTDIGA